jgi:protein SCO1/2
MKTIKLLIPLVGLLLTVATAHAGCCATNALPGCCARVQETPGTFTDKSLYQTESTWTTDANKKVALAGLAGRPQVIAMFFANCRYACPIIVNDLKRIESALPQDARRRVGFTLASFDTEHDTPAQLAAFRKIRQLPEANWTLLHGAVDDVLELAALLGVKYKRDEDGQFSHSNVITVLNAKGEIVHQQFGLGQDIKETVRHLEQLLVSAHK